MIRSTPITHKTSGSIRTGNVENKIDTMMIPRPLYDIRRWGPSMWHSFHVVCMVKDMKQSDTEVQKRTSQWIQALPGVLPCPTCAVHLKELYETMPTPSPTKDEFEVFRWSVEIHNHVNKRLGKPIVSFEDAAKLYFDKGTDPALNQDAFMKKSDYDQAKRSQESMRANVERDPKEKINSIMDSASSAILSPTWSLSEAAVLGGVAGLFLFGIIYPVRKLSKK